jgi:hypothetical protein
MQRIVNIVCQHATVPSGGCRFTGRMRGAFGSFSQDFQVSCFGLNNSF